ncbi:Alpha/beta hydrolase family-domain-containing protein [Xylogone sp. PMI_703]|nr:Alpha/beta hydrolase family-domain-containing protein [Xylogone sp. PMI_703]
MANLPTLVFVPGSWHQPTCYDKVIKLLREKHRLKCLAVRLPSTTGDPNATFKDDVDAARKAISSETTQGRDVVVIAHSYGGMVGNSAIKGFALPRGTAAGSSAPASSTTFRSQRAVTTAPSRTPSPGHVIGLILIASGFTFTGVAFMDPFFGHPPPSWRVNKETGFAEIVTPPREFFYHDLPEDEAAYWTSQLTPQSLKALFEGGEHSYAGWQDVPSWYIGTVEDHGLPVAAQRMTVGMARGMGASVVHRELQTSHSPFLSQPEETVQIMIDAVAAFTGKSLENEVASYRSKKIAVPEVRLGQPLTWYKFGLPLVFGRFLGKCVLIFGWCRRLWKSGP